MSRSTLADLILLVRDLAQCGTAEYTVGTATYWDDDHIETVLDRHRRDITHALLEPVPLHAVGGTLNYYDYRSEYPYLEQTSGGSQVFIVENSIGTDSGTATYSVDYRRGLVTFTTDQRGSIYYLTARAYDPYGAAADLMESWAAYEARSFDFSADQQSFKRSQKAEMMQKQADRLRRSAWIVSADMQRTDIDGRTHRR